MNYVINYCTSSYLSYRSRDWAWIL